MRIIALDIGDARIGIAISDVLQIIANPLETYKRKNEFLDIQYIAGLVKSHNAKCIVVGLPINMDGSEGERALLTRQFAKNLEKSVDIPIVFEDESLTTIEAEELLIEQNVGLKRRKQIIDQVAATIILRCYLNRLGKKNGG